MSGNDVGDKQAAAVEHFFLPCEAILAGAGSRTCRVCQSSFKFSKGTKNLYMHLQGSKQGHVDLLAEFERYFDSSKKGANGKRTLDACK